MANSTDIFNIISKNLTTKNLKTISTIAGKTSKKKSATAPPDTAASTEASVWTCSCGHAGNTGKFCAECGKPRSGDDKSAQKSMFVPTPEAKGKAKQLRLFAVFSWVLAVAAEAGAIIVLSTSVKPIETNTWIGMIALIAADLAFVIAGSLLWKKANRFDPASKKDKTKFFLQNQLGVIIAAAAFLPLIILIFTNKDLSGRQKKILGGIGIAALLIAGIFGIDFNPPSLEDQTTLVGELTGGNNVYWTNSGTRYHIFEDCQHINTARTNEIFEGTVAQARELKNITELCRTCENRARKTKDVEDNYQP